MKRLAILAAAVMLAALSGPGFAGHIVDVSVVDRATGKRLPVHSHDGRHYVAGTPGARYSVAIVNRSRGRLLVVVSVDGVNAITGETAATDQGGYVLGARERYEVSGWRKSTSEIAAFYFTALPDTYAARTDRPANVGVIGVAVFREYIPPRPRGRIDSRSAEAGSSASEMPAAPEASDAAPPARHPKREAEDKLGTGHGERERSEVVYTDFRRATPYPTEVVTLYYDSYANLVARGIIPRTPVVRPDPFPGGRFVPDPRG